MFQTTKNKLKKKKDLQNKKQKPKHCCSAKS